MDLHSRGCSNDTGEWIMKGASINRLACLFRHWAWADEAMARFERELAGGWDYDEDPSADHLLSAYYHWCALLCGFSEAALEQGLLSASRLDVLGPDLEASLTGHTLTHLPLSLVSPLDGGMIP
jgi:hypothetical protein